MRMQRENWGESRGKPRRHPGLGVRIDFMIEVEEMLQPCGGKRGFVRSPDEERFEGMRKKHRISIGGEI